MLYAEMQYCIENAVADFNRIMKTKIIPMDLERDQNSAVFQFPYDCSTKIGKRLNLGDVQLDIGFGFTDVYGCAFNVMNPADREIAVSRVCAGSSAVHDICSGIFIVGVLYKNLKKVASDRHYAIKIAKWNSIEILKVKDCEIEIEIERQPNRFPLTISFSFYPCLCSIWFRGEKTDCHILRLESTLHDLLSPEFGYKPFGTSLLTTLHNLDSLLGIHCSK